MDFKEALQCIFDLLALPVPDDGQQQAEFLKYLYEASAEIGNMLELCVVCETVELMPLACEIDVPALEGVLDVSYNQVSIDGYDLKYDTEMNVRALKNGHNKPNVYYFNPAKPTKILFAPKIRKRSEAIFNYVKPIVAHDLTCDDLIFDGKSPHLAHLVISRAAIKAAISCNEIERANSLAQTYSTELQTVMQTLGNPSFAEMLRKAATMDLESNRIMAAS